MRKIIGSNIILTFSDHCVIVHRYKNSNPFSRPEVFTVSFRDVFSIKVTHSVKWALRGKVEMVIPGDRIIFYFTYKYENTVLELVRLINSKIIGAT